MQLQAWSDLDQRAERLPHDEDRGSAWEDEYQGSQSLEEWYEDDQGAPWEYGPEDQGDYGGGWDAQEEYDYGQEDWGGGDDWDAGYDVDWYNGPGDD